MKYAVISDIHSNLEAFTAVLQKIDEVGVDKIICLGDIVGYNANPNECTSIIRDRNITCIAGNHDRAAAKVKEPSRFGARGKQAIFWTRKNLERENIQFLKNLPLFEVVDDAFLIVHGSLHPEPNDDTYLLIETEIMACFDTFIKDYPELKICFFGNTHLSGVYEYDGGTLSMTKINTFQIKQDALYLINPGSVGKSHNYHDKKASFIIFDQDNGSIKFYRLPFDADKCQQKLEQNHLIYKKSFIDTFKVMVVKFMRENSVFGKS